MNHEKNINRINLLKSFVYMAIDSAIIFLCYFIAYFAQYKAIALPNVLFILAVIVLKLIAANIVGIYKTIVNHFGIGDVIRFCIFIVLTNAVAIALNRFVPYFGSVNILSVLMFLSVTAMEVICVVASRCVKRFLHFYSTSDKDDKLTMIIGAGSAGKIVYDEVHNNELLHNKIVCFLDNDPEKIGKRYLGKPVEGGLNNIHVVIEKYKIEEVIIAISRLSIPELKEIVGLVTKENVKIKRLPLLTEMNIAERPQIRELSLAELLGREQITFDTKEISEFIRGKRVLVTGAGGSIGSELVRQIFSYHPSELTLFDIYENSTYDIQQELVRKIQRDGSDVILHTVIGATYNETRVNEIFERYKPQLIFHAAAYKHVPLMEDSPVEAIRTNVIGTYNVAKAANDYEAEKMVLVSTDKAVRPTNTMGATKAFAEMVIRYFSSVSKKTSYSAVRFGNVLGSNGSVIPLFKRQIEEGGPITVTHKDIIRFFMTIPEAVSLILQSGTYAKGGEIFILDMGEPVKIVTLAENVIRQCGLVPYKDIDIIFTGLRPGEKLFEELLLDVTKNEKTANSKIYVEKTKSVQPVLSQIAFIKGALTKTDNDEIKNMLKQVVTSFTDYKEFNEAHKEDRHDVRA